MSRMACIAGPTYRPKKDDGGLTELDIDELVERLTAEEIQKLLEECDPDDPHIPASSRTNYFCNKAPTGPLNRQKLLDFINEQARKAPDIPELVPYVPGIIRGKQWVPPSKPQPPQQAFFNLASSVDDETEIELEIDLGEDTENALKNASMSDIVDLAGILGLHSMMNQDQYHAAQSDKWAEKADPCLGWDGVTKATPLKVYPAEEPNRTNPEEVIVKLRDNDQEQEDVNLNNVIVKEGQFLELFDALRHNETLESLSLANTTLTDFAAANLVHALQTNNNLEKLNIESNNVSPQTLAKLFDALNVHQTIKELKASNQKAQFLGNRVEMAITKAIENNRTLLKVGLNFEFGDCRNRVAVQLQKNLDRIRLKRLAQKLSAAATMSPATTVIATNKPSTSSRTGGFLGGLPGQIPADLRLNREMTPDSDATNSEYEYYYEDEDEEDGSR